MLKRVEELKNFELYASDGSSPLGVIGDVYFDDVSWKVRYLMVAIDSKGELFLHPDVVSNVDMAKMELKVNLTREQMLTSPEIETGKLISRQYEERLQQHYGWKAYWQEPISSPFGVKPHFPAHIIQARNPIGADDSGAGAFSDSAGLDVMEGMNLLSFVEIQGYDVKTRGHTAGIIKDLIVNCEAWMIAYAIIDTADYLSVGLVVVDIRWMESFLSHGSEGLILLDLEHIRNSPRFVENQILDQNFEKVLAFYSQQLLNEQKLQDPYFV